MYRSSKTIVYTDPQKSDQKSNDWRSVFLIGSFPGKYRKLLGRKTVSEKSILFFTIFINNNKVVLCNVFSIVFCCL